MIRWLMIVGICVSPVLAACAATQSDEEQVEAVIVEFADALKDKEYANACELFTPDALSAFEEEPLGGSCEGLLLLGGGLISDQDLEKGKDIQSIEINGDKASVVTAAEDGPVQLEKIDGRWLLAEEVN